MSNAGLNRGGFSVAFGALGVIFGDIGTSPLYAMHEAHQVPGLPPGPLAAMGIASLVFWTITLIVSIKYILLITLVNDQGEGGGFALAGVLRRHMKANRAATMALSAFVIVSAALMFADSLITPPLSIMAAIEGLVEVTPAASDFVVPISVILIIGLHGVQRFGTQKLSAAFSPIMLIWFSVIGVLGFLQIVQRPDVLGAISPHHALGLVGILTWSQTLAVFGAVLLTATGAEAVYADLGHVGRKPISQAWFGVAMVGLLLNYFGQSAWLLRNPDAAIHQGNSFFSIIPPSLLLPVILLATLTTIIAGQAVITGMFSIAAQAIRQGYLPRLRILQTSEALRGQIYVPAVNMLLLLGGILLIIGFRSSSALAGSYGFAVATTMLLTTLAFCAVTIVVWQWNTLAAIAFTLLLLPLDILFFAAAVTKLPSGYFMTAVVTLLATAVMFSWRWADQRMMQRAQRLDMPLRDFAEAIELRKGLNQIQKPAIFLQHLRFDPELAITPFALLQHVNATSTMYQSTVVVEFITLPVPRVAEEERLSVHDYGQGIRFLLLRFGYWEKISIAPAIKFGIERAWWRRESDIIYYSARENLQTAHHRIMPRIAAWTAVVLQRFDQRLMQQLELDPTRCIEFGVNVDV